MTDFISRFFDWLAEPTPPRPVPNMTVDVSNLRNDPNPKSQAQIYEEAYARFEAQKAQARSLSHRLRIRAIGGELWPNASIREPHPYLGGPSTADLLNEAANEIDRLTATLNRAKNAPP